MKQKCKCGKEIIGNTSCGYICQCGLRWWWNLRKQVYELISKQ